MGSEEQIKELRKELNELKNARSREGQQMISPAWINMLPDWEGGDINQLESFLTKVDEVAALGNYSETETAKLARLKFTGKGADFLLASPHLGRADIKWNQLKDALRERYKDHTSPIFKLGTFIKLTQRKSESVKDFADRVQIEGRRACQPLPATTLEARGAMKVLEDHLIVSVFTQGLLGAPGEQLRFRPSEKLEEAMAIAVTIEQAAEQEGSANYNSMAVVRAHQLIGRDDQTLELGGKGDDVLCYGCQRKGHIRRNCPRKDRDKLDTSQSWKSSRDRGEQSRSGGRGIKCYVCQEGHLVQQCPIVKAGREAQAAGFQKNFIPKGKGSVLDPDADPENQ